jgi:hypothetical protein
MTRDESLAAGASGGVAESVADELAGGLVDGLAGGLMGEPGLAGPSLASSFMLASISCS